MVALNIGVWVRDREQFDWLHSTLDVELLRTLLPETAELTVHRIRCPNLLAVNFVIEGIPSVVVLPTTSVSTRRPRGSEWLQSRHVDVPGTVLGAAVGASSHWDPSRPSLLRRNGLRGSRSVPGWGLCGGFQGSRCVPRQGLCEVV